MLRRLRRWARKKRIGERGREERIDGGRECSIKACLVFTTPLNPLLTRSPKSELLFFEFPHARSLF